MPQLPIRSSMIALLVACSAVPLASANAETLEELDALSDLTANEASGISAAREQAGRGEYLDALATLERVMAAYPESAEARLFHALYLCQIDDRRGGLVEVDRLDERQYEAGLIDDVRARCNNVRTDPVANVSSNTAPASPAPASPAPVSSAPAPSDSGNSSGNTNSSSVNSSSVGSSADDGGSNAKGKKG